MAGLVYITMRLTVMRQVVKEMVAELRPSDGDPATAAFLADLEKHLESAKWNLWHGNVPPARRRIDAVDQGLEMPEKNAAIEDQVSHDAGQLSARSANRIR